MAAQEDGAACLIAVVSISWDTLDEAIVVANFVMQRVMSAAAGAVIRPRARRACLGPYVMRQLARLLFNSQKTCADQVRSGGQ